MALSASLRFAEQWRNAEALGHYLSAFSACISSAISAVKKSKSSDSCTADKYLLFEVIQSAENAEECTQRSQRNSGITIKPPRRGLVIEVSELGD